MKDVYLRFTDEEAAKEVLYTVVVFEQEGQEPTSYETPNYQNIDQIGIIYELKDNVSEDDEDKFIAKDGWHVNIRLVDGEDEEPLKDYEVFPQQPVRVWG